MPDTPLRRPPGEEYVKEAIWSSKRHHFSPVWIVPIVALIIGALLIWQNLSQKGPTIEITFRSAAGITPGKSSIKYKDIEVGSVKAIRFSDDLSSVIVTAELSKEMKPYLRERTKFWVVHARLSADSVEGLDTLISGAYIAMEPSSEGEAVTRFHGLEEPPILTEHTPGKRFVLEAESRGSIQQGSPIYYKKLKAGKVIGYHLTPDGRMVHIDIFVKEPFSRLVNTATRFWNASGFRAIIGTEGVEIQTESLTALLSGGIAFGNFEIFGSGKPAASMQHFILFDSKKQAQKVSYRRELYFWVEFNESIRGLKSGAPVEFRGVKVGEVVDFYLMGDANSTDFKIPILIKIEPERFNFTHEDTNQNRGELDMAIFKKLIEKGLRAQLQSANLLTGGLLINLDFYPDAAPVQLHKENGLFLLPSVPATIETLKNSVQSILNNLAAVPLKEIGEEARRTLEAVNRQTLPGVNAALTDVQKQLLPSFIKLIENSNRTLEEVRKNYLDTNAEIHRQMLRLLEEIQRTSRSVRELSDYLNRHPESLIRGR
jgi:paraquat-inducible protein B